MFLINFYGLIWFLRSFGIMQLQPINISASFRYIPCELIVSKMVYISKFDYKTETQNQVQWRFSHLAIASRFNVLIWKFQTPKKKFFNLKTLYHHRMGCVKCDFFL